MRSMPPRDRGDLTAKAVIRDEALRLFAERGAAAVSLRQIAAAAGVSPGLVIHHYGSRQGLHDAVQEHVAAVFVGMLGEATDLDWDTAETSFTELIVNALPADSPIPGYLRRLLIDGGPAGRLLFTTLLQGGRAVLDRMVAEGVVARPPADPDVLAAFLTVNDLALLLLREHLTEALGTDPLTPEGMRRWVTTALAVYREGLFTATPPDPPEPDPPEPRRATTTTTTTEEREEETR